MNRQKRKKIDFFIASVVVVERLINLMLIIASISLVIVQFYLQETMLIFIYNYESLKNIVFLFYFKIMQFKNKKKTKKSNEKTTTTKTNLSPKKKVQRNVFNIY